jgi:predicted RNase H-like nuclease
MRVAGVDGCKTGWVVWEKSGDDHAVSVNCRFADIPFARYSIVAVDMPIGLLDVAVEGGREAERLARRPLPKGRKSSVFSAPSRVTLRFADDYDEARAASKSASGGISLSIQAFNILDKIAEADRAMRKYEAARNAVREVHPEYAFALLKGGSGLAESKADAPGRRKRLDLLAGAGFVDRDMLERLSSDERPKGTQPDDVVDAAVCCWVAEGIARGDGHSLPADPPRDSKGLPMAIWGRGYLPPTLTLPRKGGRK